MQKKRYLNLFNKSLLKRINNNKKIKSHGIYSLYHDFFIFFSKYIFLSAKCKISSIV